MSPNRRDSLGFAAGALLAGLASGAAQAAAPPAPGAAASPRDFDFFLGRWQVKHRRLKARLAGSNDWEEFAGETTCWPLLGGIANANDSVSWRGGKAWRGLGLRAYDAESGTWADWSLSGASPRQIDPPGVGRFQGPVGTFLSDDSFDGRPIKVRGIFTAIQPGLAQWEQAFSADGGASWETNWVMRYVRTGDAAAG
jgi:hypothetical protein